MYNATSGAWSTQSLGQARYGLAAAALGSYILFAGGVQQVDYIDIYNVDTGPLSVSV